MIRRGPGGLRAEGGTQGRKRLRLGNMQAAVEAGVSRQAGVAVHAPLFQGYVIGAHVAFLEGVERDAQLVADGDDAGVNGAAVAIQEDRVDVPVENGLAKERRPFGERAAIVLLRLREKQPVAAVEIDLVNRRPALSQILRQPPEERAHRPLQQQDALAGECRKVNPMKGAPPLP